MEVIAGKHVKSLLELQLVNIIVNAKGLCVYYKPPAESARIHKGIMPLRGAYPAQGTN